jgi:hypothetical protein
MFRIGAHSAILMLLAGLFLLRESARPPLADLDEAFADFLSRNSRRHEERPPITFVEINDESLKEHPWPWSPLDLALFFQSGNAFAAELLATDEILAWNEEGADERSQKLPQYKKILRDNILRSPKVLLGARLGFPEDPEVIPPLQEVPLIRKLKGDLACIPEFTAIEQQTEEGFRLSSVLGFDNLPENNQPFHSVPLLLRYRGEVVPTFVLQAFLIWEKLTPDDLVVEAGKRIVVAGQFDIPIDAHGRMRVDFGVPRTRCAFDDLVLASAQVDAELVPNVPPATFKGKLLFLSRTDTKAEQLALAAGRRGSAGELFSAAIATLQARSFIRRVPAFFDWSLIALAVIATLALPRWPRGRTMAVLFVLVAVYVLAALAIFGKTLVWLPVVLPGGCLLLFVLFRLLLPARAATAPAH